MERFSAQDGKLHLVFSNADDIYDFSNGLRLRSTEEVLLYYLKKSDVDHVLFLQVDPKNATASFHFFTQETADYYARIRDAQEKSGFFVKKKKYSSGAPTETRNNGRIVYKAAVNQKDIELVTDVIVSVLQETGSSVAVVAPMKAFSSYYGSSDYCEKLVDVWTSCGTARGILVLTASDDATESTDFFLEPQGCIGKLIPDLENIMVQDSKANIFSELKNAMGSACHFLSGITEQRIYNALMRCNLRANMAYDEVFISTLSFVLEAWCKSATYRSVAELPLQRGDRYYLRDLDTYVFSRETVMQSLVAQFGCPDEKERLLRGVDDCKKEIGDYIPMYADNPLLKQLVALRERIMSMKAAPEDLEYRREMLGYMDTSMSMIRNIGLRKDCGLDGQGEDVREIINRIGMAVQEEAPVYYTMQLVMSLDAMLRYYYTAFPAAHGTAAYQFLVAKAWKDNRSSERCRFGIEKELRKYPGYYKDYDSVLYSTDVAKLGYEGIQRDYI